MVVWLVGAWSPDLCAEPASGPGGIAMDQGIPRPTGQALNLPAYREPQGSVPGGGITPQIFTAMAVALGLLSLAALPFGWDWSLGLLAGGGLALGNFRWLRLSVRHLVWSFSGRAGRPLWVLGYGLRYLVIFGLLAAVLKSGWIHPVGLLVGLAVLPVGLLAGGLTGAAARE